MALISNMTIILSNSYQKDPNKIILDPNLKVFILASKFAKRLIKGTDFKWNTIFFKIATPNTQLRTFLIQIEQFIFLHKTLQLHELECVDFKYENSFSKFQPKTSR